MRLKSAGPVLVIALAAACGSAQEPGDEARTQTELEDVALERLVMEYPVLGSEPAPEPQPENGNTTASSAPSLETTQGEATFYADTFEGRRTASGIPFRQNQMVAAHRDFPFGTLLRVTNLRNDRSVNVRVVDRGPHGDRAAARNTIIDLSRRAADTLGYIDQGRAPVRVEVLEWGEGLASAS